MNEEVRWIILFGEDNMSKELSVFSHTNPEDYHNKFIIGTIENIPNIKPKIHKHKCPICGNLGDNLIFKFYCSNSSCQNYKE